MKIPINLNEVSDEPPDAFWQYGYDEAMGGWQRACGDRTPQEQKRYDDGFDEGLNMLDAEREAERDQQ